MEKIIGLILSSVLLVGLTPSLAHAYIDPGSGSVVMTAILGFFAAVIYTIKKQFYRIKNIFFRKSEDE